jgi:hypothetical protein
MPFTPSRTSLVSPSSKPLVETFVATFVGTYPCNEKDARPHIGLDRGRTPRKSRKSSLPGKDSIKFVAKIPTKFFGGGHLVFEP